MLTFDEAREALRAYLEEHPPAMSGTLYIAPEGLEDDAAYLPTWGAREALVEWRDAYIGFDNRALFVDKQTGEITVELRNAAHKRIMKMTPVRATEA